MPLVVDGGLMDMRFLLYQAVLEHVDLSSKNALYESLQKPDWQSAERAFTYRRWQIEQNQFESQSLVCAIRRVSMSSSLAAELAVSSVLDIQSL